MKRIEIIANHSVEADIIEAVDSSGNESYYTKVPIVHGKGKSNPKMGDSVWPEENFMLIIYTERECANLIKEKINRIKIEFPDEGIKYFELG
jgi:Nitrogen regulatory protein P-II